MNFYMPVRFHTGEGSVRSGLPGLISGKSACLVVTGGHGAKSCGALDDVCSVLQDCGIGFSIFDGITANPRVADCIAAGAEAAAAGADFIIGIGGGSAMDAAKAVSVFAANPGMDEAGFYSAQWQNVPLSLFLVGTTSGTGSEVTNVSVLTDSRQRKHSIHHDGLYACAAFGDPRYTMELPSGVTLSTGIDVLTHCAESWFSRKATPVSRACAAEGIKLLLPPLRAAAAGERLSAQQRGALYDASIMGGLAICVTGTCFPHNVGYYLTENFGVPHGFACAAFLPELLEHVSRADPGYTGEFYRAAGVSREELLELTASVLPEFSFRISREELEKALPRWDGNGSVKNTIGEVTLSDIRKYLEKYL